MLHICTQQRCMLKSKSHGQFWGVPLYIDNCPTGFIHTVVVVVSTSARYTVSSAFSMIFLAKGLFFFFALFSKLGEGMFFWFFKSKKFVIAKCTQHSHYMCATACIYNIFHMPKTSYLIHALVLITFCLYNSSQNYLLPDDLQYWCCL